jgi:hypothetical protein
MYQKVACSVHIFPVPLAQMDESILMEFTDNNDSSNHDNNNSNDNNSNNDNNVQIYPDVNASNTISHSNSNGNSSL